MYDNYTKVIHVDLKNTILPSLITDPTILDTAHPFVFGVLTGGAFRAPGVGSGGFRRYATARGPSK